MIFCMLEVIAGAWFLRKFFLPLLFGREAYNSFDQLKQEKLVGFCAQIVVRASVFVQLMSILCGLWGGHLSMDTGFMANFNAKSYYHTLIESGESTSCHKAGMHHDDVAALRTWFIAKYHLIAVHLWELAFIPGLTLDTWLHHLVLVVIAAIASQPQAALGGNGLDQPLVDAVGFSFFLGAATNAFVKLPVVMYHYTAPNYLLQARCMEASIAGAWFILLFFYAAWPLFFTITHWSKFRTPTLVVILGGVLFFVLVEIRLVIVKRSIARAARKKAKAIKASQGALAGTTLLSTEAAGAGAGVFPENIHSSAFDDPEKAVKSHDVIKLDMGPACAPSPFHEGAHSAPLPLRGKAAPRNPITLFRLVEDLENQDEGRKLSQC
jgi:hypothetical protein